jgi:hypothetical protein
MMAVLGWEGFWFHVVQTRTFLLNWLQWQTFSQTFIPQKRCWVPTFAPKAPPKFCCEHWEHHLHNTKESWM